MKKLENWVGNQISHSEIIHQHALNGFAALMDEGGAASDIVPPGGHWMYFLATDRQSRIGPDGHPVKGDFLPPVELPRRMWAGGKIEFHAPLFAGDRAEKISTIKSVVEKQGRTGALTFVTVEHQVKNEAGICLTEEHDIVFREAAGETSGSKKEMQSAPDDGVWAETVTPDSVMLFRYSALTFNGHRIHYDRDYCLQEEGYPGLVVHGPLLGTLLMRLAVKNMGGRLLRKFSYRNFNPIFDTASFTLDGKPENNDECSVWVRGPAGELAVKATAEF
ncbi:MaoC family dehydratase N-terminal domain-containing protein [Sneathiella sp.]|uniref:FAS1-like dehydratase domain-containing protein n=1 Tax=Sneathiella sp. TaxID=1964365 RepID=UPI002639B033|nr:MaoC family dehydratase N-terminal domain-containing protein [Sneathiella sp.]MDF2367421.1 MaoC family dehydratase N-terminal domain-containing protein [Sneathiella sp.]